MPTTRPMLRTPSAALRSLALAVLAAASLGGGLGAGLLAGAPPARAAPDIAQLSVGLETSRPAALDTGQVLGAGLGWALGECGPRYGARLSWGQTAESNETWAVTHHEVRLLGLYGYAWPREGAVLAASLGLGAIEVFEVRDRHQADRLGLEGDDAHDRAFRLTPLAVGELEVILTVSGPWRLRVSGGPALTLDGPAAGPLRLGWQGHVGVARRL